jgi:hypothetical protein
MSKMTPTPEGQAQRVYVDRQGVVGTVAAPAPDGAFKLLIPAIIGAAMFLL